MSDFPWDQQEGETSLAYLGFTCFRDMGMARTIEGAWRDYTKQKEKQTKKKAKRSTKAKKGQSNASASFRAWSREWDWWERARAWDYWISRQANMRFIAKREKILEQQFEEMDQIAELCTKHLKGWLESLKEEPAAPIEGMTPFVAFQGLQRARNTQLAQINALAEAQAKADALVMQEIEEELEFHGDDEDEEADAA